MAEENKSSNIGNIIGVAIIIALIVVGIFVVIYVQQLGGPKDKYQQTTDTQDQSSIPKLVSIHSLNYVDNRTNANGPFLQITGFVQNAGNTSAYNCTIHVYALQPGNVTAIDISETLPFPSLNVNASDQIRMDFPLHGAGIRNIYKLFDMDNIGRIAP